jgi:DNA-binding LytR/AlgR family response regulator
MIRCLIVDDEPLASKIIATYLKPIHNLELVRICHNSIEAFNVLNEDEIDLIFLDINMPEISGIDFLKTLENPPHVIITTAYREFAVESFELDVVDYLIKPIPLQRFMKAMSRVNKLVSLNEDHEAPPNEDRFIFLKVDKKMLKIALDEIYYIESLKDYIRVNTDSGSYITHQTLTGITNILPQHEFLRIHRSFTVHLDKVTAIQGNALELDGKWLPIGRNYTHDVKARILEQGLHGS